MGLRMPSPFRHKKSGIFWLRLRVPTGLVSLVGRKEVKLSLRTRDPIMAKTAFVTEMHKIESRWRLLRSGTTSISHKEAVAIAGDFYRDLVKQHEDEPGDRTLIVGRLLSEQVAAGSKGVQIITAGRSEVAQRLMAGLKNQHRVAVQHYLNERGELIDAESFERVLQAVNLAMVQGREQVLRYADGDYRADPNAERFPKRRENVAKSLEDADKAPEHYLLTDIYDLYAKETEQAASTRKKWGAIIALVAKAHPDIRTITPDWCVAWKDSLVQQGLSPRSIQFGYLAALRSTCDWGRKNRRIASNPVEGIGIKVKSIPAGLAKRGYTDKEAKFVLGLTLKPVLDSISKHHKAARRWIPWICCYTGARVGEIAQLRKEDIKIDEGVALFWITPEAGAVKDKNPRYVAVHSHLIEQGFMDFVNAAKSGPLFYDPSLARGGTDQNPQSKKVGERICAWIRKNGITDDRLAPNHAWRHRFKTKCRSGKVDPGARDYMQGHVPHNDAEGYGEFPPDVLQYNIEILSRVLVE